MKAFSLKFRRFCAVLIGLVFLASGLLKLLDPVGTGLVVAEFAKFLRLGFIGGISRATGVVLALLESVLGAALVTGVFRRLSAAPPVCHIRPTGPNWRTKKTIFAIELGKTPCSMTNKANFVLELANYTSSMTNWALFCHRVLVMPSECRASSIVISRPLSQRHGRRAPRRRSCSRW